jgi:hypothetical protein
MLDEKERSYRRLRLTLPTERSAPGTPETVGESVSRTADQQVQTSVVDRAAPTYVLVPVSEAWSTAEPRAPAVESRRRTSGLLAASLLAGAAGGGLVFAGAGMLTHPPQTSAATAPIRPVLAAPGPAPIGARLAALGTPVYGARTGLILLRPRDCATHGRGIRKGAGDIGHWSSSSAYVTWVAETRASGPYALQLTYACGNNCGGDFEAVVGKQHFRSRSTSTGGWDRYRPARIAVAQLPRGRFVVKVRPLGPIKTALMSLQRVKLMPIRS